jgi:hypothetical protein
MGQISPLCRGSEAMPPQKKLAIFCVRFWAIFRHMDFADDFLFPVKELGLLTKPGYWIRVLDAMGSYMYIVL